MKELFSLAVERRQSCSVSNCEIACICTLLSSVELGLLGLNSLSLKISFRKIPCSPYFIQKAPVISFSGRRVG